MTPATGGSPQRLEGVETMVKYRVVATAGRRWTLPVPGVAQLVEQLIRNQQVIGSSPIAGFTF